jgi:hypothetical protein
MSNEAAWAGWVFTAGQALYLLIEIFVWRTKNRQLEAIRDALAVQRANCTEAIETKRVIKTDDAAQWVSSVAYALVGLERQIDAVIGTRRPR